MWRFRKECRLCRHWLNVQREDSSGSGSSATGIIPTHDGLFRRSPDRARADEVRRNGTLYRGSKPVMWSVVEKTALAEAESSTRITPRYGVGEISVVSPAHGALPRRAS